jgi:TolB protein
MHVFARLLLLFCVSVAVRANAELTIEITAQALKQLPLSVTGFKSEGALPQSLSAVIKSDLFGTGLFKEIDSGAAQPFEPKDVESRVWRDKGAEALVFGKVTPLAQGRVEVVFYLADVLRERVLKSLAFTIGPGQSRATAHKIADEVYQSLTGERGVFSTKIAYIVKEGVTYRLMIADADGYGEQKILESREPIISPKWAPDGNRLAYVTFEERKPIVMVQSIITGTRLKAAAFKGSNSAPAWSPDGKRLAVTLTKDGGSQIYLVNADGSGSPARLTSSPSIDTEPVFSPDGSYIAFTSDRGGRPQIYRVPVTGGNVERLTFSGKYNVSPRFSPDGKRLVFVQQDGDSFRVMQQDLVEGGQAQVMTDSDQDESPSFAPNGKLILYATQVRGRGVLATVSSDGRVRQRLFTQAADVREPTWGPLR